MTIRDQISGWHDGTETATLNTIDIYEHILAGHGMKLETGHDFKVFKDLHQGLQKQPLMPNFDPAVSPLNADDAFWMTGVDRFGEIVMTQCARIYVCQGATLADLHHDLRAFYADPARHAGAGETCRVDAPAATKMSGRIAYHGELWLAPSYRGRMLSGPVSKLLMMLVVLKWAPDYLFGLAQPGIVTKGVAARYGYRNMQPDGMIWTRPGMETLREWIIWNDSDDLQTILITP